MHCEYPTTRNIRGHCLVWFDSHHECKLSMWYLWTGPCDKLMHYTKSWEIPLIPWISYAHSTSICLHSCNNPKLPRLQSFVNLNSQAAPFADEVSKLQQYFVGEISAKNRIKGKINWETPINSSMLHLMRSICVFQLMVRSSVCRWFNKSLV